MTHPWNEGEPVEGHRSCRAGPSDHRRGCRAIGVLLGLEETANA